MIPINLGLEIFDSMSFFVFRYLNLVHIYLHKHTTAHIRDLVTDEKLYHCGFLTQQEMKELSSADDKRRVVMRWLGEFLLDNLDGVASYVVLMNFACTTISLKKNTFFLPIYF